jgi:hypothetical protein
MLFFDATVAVFAVQIGVILHVLDLPLTVRIQLQLLNSCNDG